MEIVWFPDGWHSIVWKSVDFSCNLVNLSFEFGEWKKIVKLCILFELI